MKLPKLQPVEENESFHFGYKERKRNQKVEECDLYIVDTDEFKGIIKIRIKPKKWQANIRVSKGESGDFVNLANKLKEIRGSDYKKLNSLMENYGLHNVLNKFANIIDEI